MDGATPSPLALTYHVAAAYGLAWLLTESDALAWLRAGAGRVRFFRALFDCVICTSVWVSLGLALLAPWASVPLVAPGTAVDAVVLVGWTVAGVAALSRWVSG